MRGFREDAMPHDNDKLVRRRANLPAEKQAELERRLQAARHRRAPEAAAIPPAPRSAPVPLSFAQERLWFLYHFDRDSAAYNRPTSFRLTGELDRDALRASLDEICNRHAALRTRFRVIDETPTQYIAADATLPLAFNDLSSRPPADREREARRIAVAEARAPFDLEGGPLARGRLVRLGERDHVLLLTFHHAVFDGWSEQILKQELAQLYSARRRGEPCSLAPLPVQYADYAAWLRGRLRDDELQRQLDFWMAQLEGTPRVLELPADRPRASEHADHGARRTRRVPLETADALRRLARRQGATLFMALLAGFDALVHRYTGREDFVIGVPVAGRGSVELERLIGLFINMLPLRARVSAGDTFFSLLEQVKSASLGAFAHQDLPFEKLVERLEPARSLSHAPLIQVTFQLRNMPQATAQPAGLELSRYVVDSAFTQFDLSLEITECDDGLECTAVFSTALFDAATIDRMLEHYEYLLKQAAADPAARIADYTLLTPREQRQFRKTVNVLRAQFPVNRCLHERIEEQAARTPHAVAVSDGGGARLTYSELNARANQLARQLQSRGVGTEQLVALAMPRSIDTVVGILGILKAGGAYLPLDLSHPDERLRMLLDDARPAAILSTSELLPRFAADGPPVVCLDGDAGQISREDDRNLGADARPEYLAYVIYTSGSTGRPKGVMVEHRQVVRLIDATQDDFQFTEHDVWTVFHSFAFDFSVWELFGPLLTGGRCVIVPRDVARSPADFLELLRRERVTVLNQTPSAFRPLDRADAEANETAGELTLRLIIFAGESLEPAHVKAWIARRGDSSPRLVNMYGITETTVHVTVRTMTAADLAHENRSFIGLPMADLKILLLDANGQPVPDGLPGEIYVGGAGVARGYLNRPELTAERFLADRFAPESGGRLYRSGDLARRLPDGELEFLGRIDQQVQIRGFRVEPGEIEAALASHPRVADAAVVPRADADGALQLYAYLVPREEEHAAADELAGWLRQTLPEHMIPAGFVYLDALPLTVNGKLDRAALPDPGTSRPELQVGFAAPRDDTERKMAALWSELLRVEPIGRDDNFFTLGGHSLLAVQLVSRVRDRWSRELPLRTVFDAPTVKGLCEYLVEHAADDASAEAPALEPLPRGVSFPLSFSQEQFALLAELHPDVPLYNETIAIRIAGAIDFAVLARSFNELVRRHEILRTVIVREGDELAQSILPHVTIPLSYVDLSYHPADEREAEAMRLADQEARAMFDLQRGPMLRASLFRFDDETHLLCLACHHLVIDRESTGVLLNDLAAIYQAFRENRPSPLPPLEIQYADYAAWQRRRAPASAQEADLQFWRRQLAGAPPLVLPTDRPAASKRSFAGARRYVDVPPALASAVESLSRREETTPFVTLLAAFQALLSRYSGQEDVVVGTVISDRDQPLLRGVMGCFLNTAVMRTDLSGEPTFRELMRRVRAVAVDAVEHRQVPFASLVEQMHLGQRSSAQNPLFNVAFVLEPAFDEQHAGWSLNRKKGYSGISKFDLVLLADRFTQNGFFVLEYSTEQFDAETAQRFLDHYVALLERLLADPDRPIAEVPILTDEERGRLIAPDDAADNAAESAPQSDTCLHEMIEAQVVRTPNAPAVACEGRVLTYRELNDRADRLAQRLRALGIGPESLVALCVERSTDLIVGILGILKSGGAYVPLEPSQPAQRLAALIDDGRPGAIVTQQALASHVGGRGIPQVLLEELDDDAPAAASEADSPRCMPHNLAYVVYTSGSTGRPKGVAVEHRQIVNYVRGLLERTEFPEGMSFATVSTIAADLGNTVIFPALVTGGCLHVVSRECAADPHALAEYFARHPIDCLKIVPSHLAALMSGPEPARLMPRRYLILGGEASRCEWVAECQRLSPRTAIFNHYGPTETTVGVLACRVGPGELTAASGTLPLGQPLRNSRAYVLDAHMQPVPVGVPGELYIGGAGVARGYLKQPELTEKSFLPDPFFNDLRQRLYKTGDRARLLPDGNFEFLGRVDNQVKIRGYRIELGEVEAVLREHPDVAEAVVLAHEPQPGDRRLTGYVVPRAGQPAAPTDRGAYKLPNGMRVAQINRNETDYIYHEVFELQAYLRHGVTLAEGDCVFDVGANIGLFSLFAGRVCPGVRVCAFEPNPVVFAALEQNVGRYSAGAKLFQCGLSSENKIAEFTFYEGFSLLSGYYADAETERDVVKQYIRNQQILEGEDAAAMAEQTDELLKERFTSRTFHTELRTLSSVMREERIERIDLLKINVEKSELDVLLGIEDDDWEKIGQIVVEIDVPEHRGRIVSMLERRGYEVLIEQDRLLDQTPLCYVYAIRPTEQRRLIREQEAGAHVVPIEAVSDGPLEPADLERFAARRLPDYMIPESFVMLEALPLTANGKLDRQRLASAGQLRTRSGADYVAPRTPLEEILADVWKGVLHVDRVGINDNFFDLGGHSLLAMRVVSRLRAEFSLELAVRAMFECPTIELLALTLLRELSKQADAPANERRPGPAAADLSPGDGIAG